MRLSAVRFQLCSLAASDSLWAPHEVFICCAKRERLTLRFPHANLVFETFGTAFLLTRSGNGELFCPGSGSHMVAVFGGSAVTFGALQLSGNNDGNDSPGFCFKSPSLQSNQLTNEEE